MLTEDVCLPHCLWFCLNGVEFGFAFFQLVSITHFISEVR